MCLCIYVCRKVKDLNWLAEATYTGEALDYTLKTTVQRMRPQNRVVIVLTDGRANTERDKTPLTVLCGKDIRVSTLQQTRLYGDA